MKILHIVRQFYPAIGGLENYVYNLANYQINNGNEVTVITLNKNFLNGKKLKDHETLKNGVNVIRIPYFFSKKYPIALKVFNHLKNYEIINVHALDFFADFISITKPFHRKKTVLITHGGFFHTKWGFFLKKIYFNLITRFSIKTYNKIIGCSENDIELFNKVTKRIMLIDNGVNIEPYLKTPKNRKRGNLLYVGRLDHHKRIDLLIKLTANLIKNDIKVRLDIVGPDSQDLKKNLFQLANDLNIQDSVNITGAVSETELLRFYSEADLFLSASEYEGFGLTAVEALASGTPCLLSNIKSFQNILKDYEFGKVLDFKNINLSTSMTMNFLILNKDEYNILSNKARIYCQNYSWNNVGKHFQTLYDELNN